MKKLLLLVGASALMFTGCYLPTSIDSGEVGVVKNWGEVQDKTINAGLTFSLMPGDDLYVMKVTNKQAVFTDRPIAEEARVADTIYSNGVSVMTEQQLPIPLDISCLYQLNPNQATTIMKQFGQDGVWDDKIIVREVRSTVRDVMGKISLEKLNTERSVYEEKIRLVLNQKLSKYGVSMTTFNIQNIGIPKSIQDSVLAKEQAKQAAEKAKYLVEQAKQEALVEIEKSTGIAKANDILAHSLTDELVKYKQLEIQRVQADAWNGVMPTTLAGGNTPLMLMTK